MAENPTLQIELDTSTAEAQLDRLEARVRGIAGLLPGVPAELRDYIWRIVYSEARQADVAALRADLIATNVCERIGAEAGL